MAAPRTFTPLCCRCGRPAIRVHHLAKLGACEQCCRFYDADRTRRPAYSFEIRQGFGEWWFAVKDHGVVVEDGFRPTREEALDAAMSLVNAWHDEAAYYAAK